MPTIRVELFEGRTPEQKRNLVRALTQAAPYQPCAASGVTIRRR